jgi:hypothetical protein
MERRSQVCLTVLVFLIGAGIGYFAGRTHEKHESKPQPTIAPTAKPTVASIPKFKYRGGGTTLSPERQGDLSLENTKTRRQSSAEMELKLQKQDEEQALTQKAAERAVEYGEVYSQLGLTSEASARFQTNLIALHAGAQAAGNALTSLARAKVEYDRDIREALGEDGYARYRQYEDEKPARLEFDRLNQYSLSVSNITYTPDQQMAIVRLIKQAGAVTSELWAEPYGSLPRQVVGQQGLVDDLRKKIVSLKAASDALNLNLQETSMQDDYRKLIEAYYQSVLNKLQEQLRYFDRPIEVLREEDMQEYIRLKATKKAP